MIDVPVWKGLFPGNPNIAKGALYNYREKLMIYCEIGSWVEEYAYFDDIPYHYVDPSSDLELSENQSLVNNSSNLNYTVTNIRTLLQVNGSRIVLVDDIKIQIIVTLQINGNRLMASDIFFKKRVIWQLDGCIIIRNGII